MWDYAESNPLSEMAGSYNLCFNRVVGSLETNQSMMSEANPPTVLCQSAINNQFRDVDVILTIRHTMMRFHTQI